MFQFHRCPPAPASQLQQTALVSSHHGRGVAPFGFGRLIACMQLPNHVSPRSASFFGPWPLGIHPAPSPAWRFSSPCWCCILRSIAIRSQNKSAPRIGKYEKTSDNTSYSFRAPHSADGFSREHPTIVVASTSHYAVVHVRCAVLSRFNISGGNGICPRKPTLVFRKAPPEYSIASR
jgi:hypothetical protein